MMLFKRPECDDNLATHALRSEGSAGRKAGIPAIP